MKVKLDFEKIKRMARDCKHEHDFVIAMYKEAYGPDCFDADGPEKLDWPVCNRETWIALCNLAMGVARRNEECHMPGGTWMNMGFSSTQCEDALLNYMEVQVPDRPAPAAPADTPTDPASPSVTGQTTAPATPA